MSLFPEPHFVLIQVEHITKGDNKPLVEEVIIDDGNDLKRLISRFKKIRTNSHTDIYPDKEMLTYFKLLDNKTQKSLLSSYSTAVINSTEIKNQTNNLNEDL